MSDKTAPNLPLEVLGMFRVIFKSASKHFEDIEKSIGVSGAQLWALSEIMEAGTITISNIAKAMSVHQSTASNLVEKLEIHGLVERVRSTQDRRVVEVRMTPVGLDTLAEAPGPYRGILPDALMRMPQNELLELRCTLHKLLGYLEKNKGIWQGSHWGYPSLPSPGRIFIFSDPESDHPVELFHSDDFMSHAVRIYADVAQASFVVGYEL